jgi:transposase
VVKDYVRGARLQRKEVFVPLVHPPGDAQVNFGEALVVIGGEEQKAHFLCMDLPQSNDCFVMAFPAENTEECRKRRDRKLWGRERNRRPALRTRPGEATAVAGNAVCSLR